VSREFTSAGFLCPYKAETESPTERTSRDLTFPNHQVRRASAPILFQLFHIVGFPRLLRLRADRLTFILITVPPRLACGARSGRGRFVFSSSGDRIRDVSNPSEKKPSLLRLNAIAESLFTTLFPSDCRLCGEPLVRISRLPVCESCLTAIRPIDGLACGICGERLTSRYTVSSLDGIARCGNCERQNPAFTKAVAYGSYDGGLRELIHLLKYDHVRPAAGVLGRMLAEALCNLQPSFGDRLPLIIPVPLHREKARQRGFNQSELIARSAMKAGVGDVPQLEVNVSAVARVRTTESQTGLTRHQRLENIRGAFAVIRPEEVDGRDIVLVDDVFTTGTTVSECARVLRKAGAEQVWAATVARVLRPEAAFSVEQELSEVQEAPLAMAAHA